MGFGALNVDLIAGSSGLSAHAAEHVTESIARFEWNRETPVDEGTILEVVDRLDAASLSASLGGSAWITLFTLAQMRAGLRLGYVGVVGRMVKPGLSFTGQMDRLAIDRRWVAQVSGRSCGICLSYIDDTDRVMLTHPGANFEMGAYLRRHSVQIAEYLASARHVHVTSFLDEETPGEMVRILRKAKQLDPLLRVSFDPGYDWAVHRSRDIAGLLELADLVFVNYREFKALGEYAHGESDEAIADKALGRCAPRCVMFVTKRYDLVQVFRRGPNGISARKFHLERPTRETDIEDATGAGDVFAAGVLASASSARLRLELGAYLGLSLARYKAQQRPGRPVVLPDLSNGFLQQRESLPPSGRRPPGVLLVHDGHPQRHELRHFIERRCGLRLYELTSEVACGREAESALRDHLDRCCFAVCLLSSQESFPRSERYRSDQSIIHQAGLLHGRYGFDRVAILAEHGCDTFSNIAGLIRLDFPKNRVHSVFLELERMLAREGMLRGGRSDG
ncbi:nucleotide-binding protein [Streptomyces sp. JJ36]|nr:nucleotide-binding protein [Streptomyces sp. JJ36]